MAHRLPPAGIVTPLSEHYANYRIIPIQMPPCPKNLTQVNVCSLRPKFVCLSKSSEDNCCRPIKSCCRKCPVSVECCVASACPAPSTCCLPESCCVPKRCCSPDPCCVTKIVCSPDPCCVTKVCCPLDPCCVTKVCCPPDPCCVTKVVCPPDPCCVTKVVCPPDPCCVTKVCCPPDPCCVTKVICPPQPCCVPKPCCPPKRCCVIRPCCVPKRCCVPKTCCVVKKSIDTCDCAVAAAGCEGDSYALTIKIPNGPEKVLKQQLRKKMNKLHMDMHKLDNTLMCLECKPPPQPCISKPCKIVNCCEKPVTYDLCYFPVTCSQKTICTPFYGKKKSGFERPKV